MSRYSAATPLVFAALLAGAAAAPAADTFPTKPIRVVVPQPPGGSTDAVARLYAQKMAETLGQQIVIDNRAGSGVASVGVQALVSTANPDGYTLLAVTPSFTFMPALTKDARVRTEDFAPVTLLSRDPYMLSIYPGLPVKSVKEFIAFAKAKPGFLNMGSGNIGSGTHLVSMLFLSEGRIRDDVVYVPYKGTGLAFTDLMAGRLHAGVSSIVSGGPHVKAGRLRALGVTGAQRSPTWPDLPTIAEQGLAGFEATAWYGLVAPAKTPTSITAKLGAAAARAAKTPDLGDKIRALGGDPVGSTPAEFRQLITRESPRWRTLIDQLGMTGSMH